MEEKKKTEMGYKDFSKPSKNGKKKVKRYPKQEKSPKVNLRRACKGPTQVLQPFEIDSNKAGVLEFAIPSQCNTTWNRPVKLYYRSLSASNQQRYIAGKTCIHT